VIRHLKDRPPIAKAPEQMRELLVNSVMNFVASNRSPKPD
jgi:hypothetical protein